MDTSELEKHLEIARQRMNSLVHYKNPGEFQQARATVLSLERKIAAERGEEYADSLDFPVHWDTGAPLPQLIANDYRTFFYVSTVDGPFARNIRTLSNRYAGRAMHWSTGFHYEPFTFLTGKSRKLTSISATASLLKPLPMVATARLALYLPS